MPRYTNPQNAITLTYQAGDLTLIEIMAGGDFQQEQHLIALSEYNLDLTHWTLIKTPAVDEKIALFCHAFSAYTLQFGQPLPYKVSKVDVGLLKNLEVTEDLLRVFFTTEFWTKVKNISNYNKHINEIREILLTGKDPNQRDGNSRGQEGNQSLADTLRQRYQG